MKFAFLGAGKMALALVHGMLRAKVCAAPEIFVASRSDGGAENFSEATSTVAMASNFAAAEAADVVILCVKPADALAAVADAAGALSGKLLISVVTGLTNARLSHALPDTRLIRAMPNTAAMVGRSATAIAPHESATREDIEAAMRIFEAVGNVHDVAEGQFDAITGLSGSGPAFVYLVLEALSDGGVAAGLPRPLALELAIETLGGAAEMAASTREHPALLREMVTSPGGTTVAGLTALEDGGVRAAFIHAVKAAARRAQELS